jgi:hypothetical protein
MDLNDIRLFVQVARAGSFASIRGYGSSSCSTTPAAT